MRKQTAFFFLVILFLMAFGTGAARAQSAEEAIDALDLSALEEIGGGTGLNVREMLKSLLSGEIRLDAKQAIEIVRNTLKEKLSSAGTWMLALCLPTVILAVMKRISGDGAAAKTAGFICYLAAASVLIGLTTEAIREARVAVSLTVKLNNALFPVLTTILAIGGKTASAAAFTPTASLFGGVFGWAIQSLILPLCGAGAALIVAGNLSEQIKLSSMTSLILSACKWILGFCSTILMGVLSMQGILGGGQDGASIRTAKFAVDSLLPIIGGDVGDALELIGTNASLIKGAVGVTGLVVLAALTAGPVIQLIGIMFLMRLAVALTEPIETGRSQKMMAQFGEVVGVLVATVATSSLLSVLLVGAVLKMV